MPRTSSLGSDVDCRGVTGGGDVPDDRCRTVGVIGECGLVEMVADRGRRQGSGQTGESPDEGAAIWGSGGRRLGGFAGGRAI